MATSRMILLSPLIALVGDRLRPGPCPGAGPGSRVATGGRGPLGPAQPAPDQKTQPQAAPDPARMKWLLKAWEGQSAS